MRKLPPHVADLRADISALDLDGETMPIAGERFDPTRHVPNGSSRP